MTGSVAKNRFNLICRWLGFATDPDLIRINLLGKTRWSESTTTRTATIPDQASKYQQQPIRVER